MLKNYVLFFILLGTVLRDVDGVARRPVRIL